MALNTYLTFEDNCREAFEFYRSVFGGEFTYISTFREGPEEMKEMEIPEDHLDRIMHVSLPIGNSVLMGSGQYFLVLPAAGCRQQLLTVL